MKNKTLYVSNIVRLSKRGKIINFTETEKEFIFQVEGKKKIYNYDKNTSYLLVSNKTVAVMKKLDKLDEQKNIVYK